MKKTFLISLFLFASFFSFSQVVNITSYSVYALGAGIQVHENVCLEMKTFANRGSFENTFFEFAGAYQFKPKDFHRFSLGVGVGGLNWEESSGYIVFPAAIEIYPLQSFKRISLLFELAPKFYTEGGVDLRHFWGIRYTFGSKNQ